MEPADDGTAGFTLVEVLVALSIVGLLSATLLGFAGQLGRIASLEPRLVERREAEMAADFLARTVGDALPLGLDRRADTVVPFEGAGDAVRFVGPIRTGVRATGLRTIQFDLDGTDLRLYALPRRPLGPKPDIEPEVMAMDVASLALRYWGPTEGDPDRLDWHDDWRERTDLPRAVAVNVAIERSGRTIRGAAVAIVHAAD